MFVCQILRNPHTSLLSPPAPVLSSPFHTFLPVLLFLSLFFPPHAILASTPSLLPIASPRGTFAPGGCSLCIHHTSSFLPSSLAALLPSLAVPLYLDSPIGHVPPPYNPNTSLAALFPRRGIPHFLLPSSYILCLVGAQTYCPHPLTSFFSLLVSPSAYSGGPSGRTTHICNICGHLFFLSSFQCMSGYRAL